MENSMTDKKTVLDMKNAELWKGCRRTAEKTQFWHNDYYREIERRTQHRHTIAIGALTLIATIATVISVLK